jgi:hypothetical protein
MRAADLRSLAVELMHDPHPLRVTQIAARVAAIAEELRELEHQPVPVGFRVPERAPFLPRLAG